MSDLARSHGEPGSREQSPQAVSAFGFDPSRGELVRSLQRIIKLSDIEEIYVEAQRALDGLPEARHLRIADLTSNSASARYNAIHWLADRLDPYVHALLREMYADEPNRTIRALLKGVLRDAAQGIEARSDEAQNGSAEGEDLVAKGDAP